MSDYGHRVLTALLGSEFLPATARMAIMRRLGYDFAKSSCLWAGASLRGKNVKFGENVFVNVGLFHDGYAQLTVEDNVRMGQFVRILTASHPIGPPHQRAIKDVLGGPVTIGKGCWIGAGVTILPNVRIAEGCVIATGAVVAESTEPNGLYAGNPARFVRPLSV
jgi:maltose O-acetyltransferase